MLVLAWALSHDPLYREENWGHSQANMSVSLPPPSRFSNMNEWRQRKIENRITAIHVGEKKNVASFSNVMLDKVKRIGIAYKPRSFSFSSNSFMSSRKSHLGATLKLMTQKIPTDIWYKMAHFLYRFKGGGGGGGGGLNGWLETQLYSTWEIIILIWCDIELRFVKALRPQVTNVHAFHFPLLFHT